jgi:hypothetical protein
MATRPKWLPPKIPDNNPFLVRASSTEDWFLFDHDPVTEVWITAFRDVDGAGDANDLVRLLKSKYAMSDAARFYLADLIERHRFKRKKGEQKTPAYTKSEVEQFLTKAVWKVQAEVERGISVAKALDKISKSLGVPDGLVDDFYTTLSNAYLKRRQAPRRTKRNRP